MRRAGALLLLLLLFGAAWASCYAALVTPPALRPLYPPPAHP